MPTSALDPLQRLLRARRFRDFYLTSNSQRTTAARFRVSVWLINREVAWVRALEPDPDPEDLFRIRLLIPTFGQGNKPLARLTCKDVHPCRNCSGLGFILDLIDFLFRRTDGDPVYYIDCPGCNGSGVARLDRDYTSICCGVCYKSGRDSHPALRSWPLPERTDAAGEPTIYDPPKGLKGGLG
jgi:hypothetical protein